MTTHRVRVLYSSVRLLFALVMMASPGLFLGCASTSTSEGTGEYLDDSVITAKVKAAILNEPGLKVREINVETFKGVVQLSGFVSSSEAIERAVELTRGVAGVKDVRNSMQVK